MIGKSVWKRGILILGLLTAAAIFYVMSQVEDTSRESTGTLVFSNQFMPGIDPESEATSAAVDVDGARIGATDAEKHGDLEAVPALAAAGLEAPPQSAGSLALPAAADENTGAGNPRSPAFDMYRLVREQNRSRQIEAIEALLGTDRLTDAERRELQAQLLQIVATRDLEESAEGLLIARGLSDVVVMLGRSGAEVVVVDTLDQNDAARVGDVVARIAGIPLDAITIVDGAARN